MNAANRALRSARRAWRALRHLAFERSRVVRRVMFERSRAVRRLLFERPRAVRGLAFERSRGACRFAFGPPRAVCVVRRLAVPAAAAALVLSAPAALAKETKLPSEVVAAQNINPNRHGDPQPVLVHVYYLKHDEAFRQANFAELVAPQAPILSGDLIREAEQLVGPGESAELDGKFDEATQFIGVVAEFTKIGQAAWRAVIAVPAKKWTDVLKLFKGKKLQIRVDGTKVSCAILEE